MDPTKLSAVFDWKMTNDEAHAYYLATVWEQETRNIKDAVRIPKSKDPRKCTLFRFCWKLVRETRGLLKANEYPEYIRGQLKIIARYGGRIDPNCLVGDKAWIRWRIWQRALANQMAKANQQPVPHDVNLNPKIVAELDKTKRFIYEKMDGNPSKEKLDYNKLTVWVETGKVSKYWVCLSEWTKDVLDKLEKECSFSRDVYIIDESINKFFKKEFDYENLS